MTVLASNAFRVFKGTFPIADIHPPLQDPVQRPSGAA